MKKYLLFNVSCYSVKFIGYFDSFASCKEFINEEVDGGGLEEEHDHWIVKSLSSGMWRKFWFTEGERRVLVGKTFDGSSFDRSMLSKRC